MNHHTWILGISALYHDSAAALLCDGKIVAAAQEERFTRKKHDHGFPHHAIAYCLAESGCRMEDLSHVVFYEKPFLKFERLLETYIALAPRGFSSFAKAMPVWIGEKLFQKRMLRRELMALGAPKNIESRFLFTEHHMSHAASAFFPSPFREAAILTMDGVGEWATTSVAMGRDNSIEMLQEIHFPHSLGLLYSSFTYFLGFKVNSGEYKVMGLAPYGKPRFTAKIMEHLLEINPDGSFRLNMEYFNYCSGLTMTHDRFGDLFGMKARTAEQMLTNDHMDMAASIQEAIELAVLNLARAVRTATGLRHLCLAGGVALNCVVNGKLLREGIFDDLWVQPASGDAGGSLGAALAAYHLHLKHERPTPSGDAMMGSFLGPACSMEDTELALKKWNAHYEILEEGDLIEHCAKILAKGETMAWAQGRMEFGPRALGARSIIGDPRSPQMQSILNLKVKFRESFRPFAPAILRGHVAEWFELDKESPYMLLVAPVRPDRRLPVPRESENLFGIDRLKVPRSTVPAITHVDYSARVQTVHENTNPLFYMLIKRFNELTGCPLLVNTSFNVRGEPIVCTADDAYRCFMGTELEWLVVNRCLLQKSLQPPENRQRYQDKFDLD